MSNVKTTAHCPTTHNLLLAALAALVTMHAACGTEPNDAAGASAALGDEEHAPSVDYARPIADDAPAPVVVDAVRVDRATEALTARLARIDDPEARMAARFEQFDTEEAALVRDVSLDRRSAVATAAAIRARLFGTEEAARDGEAADLARRDRGEHTALTSADFAAFDAARGRLAARTGRTEPAPVELRTPDGVATPMSPPTAEELRRAY